MSRDTRGVSAHEQDPAKLRGRTLWLWALANSLAGLGIGSAILLIEGGDVSPRGLIPMSMVFANVVGFAAVLAVKYVLPRYSGFPGFVRLPLAVLTLIAGGVLGSGLAILVNPLVVLYEMRLALLVVAINGVLAVIVGLITYAYEQMRSQIEAEAAERGKLEHEMNVARSIQMELLPKIFPNIPGLDMYAFSVPAKHVGGDCYDVIDIGSGLLGVTIGDVSGKGTPAAILMANVQAAVRALSESGVPAGELIGRVNKLIHGYTEEGVFITLFYSVLDTRSGDLTYVNAGHNPPCVLRRNGEREYLEKGGLIIGIMPVAEYEVGHVTLAPGDDLVLYTDGVTEAMNPNDEMFGQERLERLLWAHREGSAREIEEQVYNSIKEFTAGASQTDDLTMVIVKMMPETADRESRTDPDSPRMANGGPSAARGAPSTGDLRGPATANASEPLRPS